MGLAKVDRTERQRGVYFYYQVAGVGEFMSKMVHEPDVKVRDKMAVELIDFLYPTTEAELLIRVREPMPEVIGDK